MIYYAVEAQLRGSPRTMNSKDSNTAAAPLLTQESARTIIEAVGEQARNSLGKPLKLSSKPILDWTFIWG